MKDGSSAAAFDLGALHAALDAERRRRALTWTAVVREINRGVAGRLISASTVANLQTASSSEGDGVLQMLRWLGRSPESFVAGFPDAGQPRYRLPEPPERQLIRWDTAALHAALDAERRRREMTWKNVAESLGGVTPSMLTGLARGGRTSFPAVMRIVRWLDQPAAAFTRVSAR